MNAPTFSNQLLPTAPPLAWTTPGSCPLPQAARSAPRLRLLPDSPARRIESLHEYCTRAQRQVVSAEKIAFAALALSGAAGVMAGLYF